VVKRCSWIYSMTLLGLEYGSEEFTFMHLCLTFTKVLIHACIVHIIESFVGIHRMKNQNRYSFDAIPHIATDLASEAWMLCFDEFQVSYLLHSNRIHLHSFVLRDYFRHLYIFLPFLTCLPSMTRRLWIIISCSCICTFFFLSLLVFRV
jgi:hypothetical protein